MQPSKRRSVTDSWVPKPFICPFPRHDLLLLYVPHSGLAFHCATHPYMSYQRTGSLKYKFLFTESKSRQKSSNYSLAETLQEHWVDINFVNQHNYQYSYSFTSGSGPNRSCLNLLEYAGLLQTSILGQSGWKCETKHIFYYHFEFCNYFQGSLRSRHRIMCTLHTGLAAPHACTYTCVCPLCCAALFTCHEGVHFLSTRLLSSGNQKTVL